MPPTYSTKLDDQLCFALYATSNAVTRFYRPHLQALGLTYPQYITMLALWEQDGVMVATLGTRLGLDSGTMTPLLKRLEAAGLLRRRRDDQDERRVVISLTPAGKALQKRASGVPEALACALDLSVSEVEQLVATLEGLRGKLRAASDES